MRPARVWAVCAAMLSAATSLRAQGEAADSIVYLLVPASRFEVKTGSAGLLGFAGHDHLIRARAFSGRVVYRPGDAPASHVELVVRADSLEVLTPPDTAEIRKVTASMRDETLDVAHYPEIRFASTTVTASAGGLRIHGALTIRGRTQTVVVDVRTETHEDSLRVSGTFSVKQTDFGIRPYRGGPAGTVKVADRIQFDFDAIAVRMRVAR